MNLTPEQKEKINRLLVQDGKEEEAKAAARLLELQNKQQAQQQSN